MNRTVGDLKKNEVYALMLQYGNELNVCVNAEQDVSKPCIPVHMDKRAKYRVFEFVNK